MRPNVVRELLGRWRVVLFLVVFLVELMIFFLATSIPISSSAQLELQKEAQNLTGVTHGLGPTGLFEYILTHNAVIAFGEMIPIVGGFLWVVSIYATGQVVQVAAISHGAPGALYGLLLLFFPFTIVELSAYTVSVASGIMLIVAWRRHVLNREVWVLVLEACLVAALLSCAAAMETVTIMNPTLGFSLWIPMGATIAALALITSRAMR
jgi:hypothetical protein